MSEELYLILHKVRGEPAFDIAQRLDCEEEVWIIPTSGHRAYPFHWIPLEYIHQQASLAFPPVSIPDNWPDHYAIHAAAKRTPIKDLLAAIGITPPTLKRRKISC